MPTHNRLEIHPHIPRFLWAIAVTFFGIGLDIRLDPEPDPATCKHNQLFPKEGIENPEQLALQDHLSLEESLELTACLNELLGSLPPSTITPSQESLENIIFDLARYIGVENIDDSTTLPTEIGFEHYLNNRYTILGTSNCESSIMLNYRFINPDAGWQRSDIFITTAAHELIHVQQGRAVCTTADRTDLEASANVAALELLARGAMTGNNNYLRAYIYLLQNMVKNYALAEALRQGRSEEYFEFIVDMQGGDALDDSLTTLTQWRINSDSAFSESIQRYAVRPTEMLFNALKNNNQTTELVLAPETAPYSNGSPSTAIRGVVLDCSAYVMRNLSQMVMAQRNR